MPVIRHEHPAPGDLLHLDIKHLGRFTEIAVRTDVAERTHRGRETSVNRPSGPLRTIRNRTGRVLMVRNKQERWNKPTPNAG